MNHTTKQIVLNQAKLFLTLFLVNDYINIILFTTDDRIRIIHKLLI